MSPTRPSETAAWLSKWQATFGQKWLQVYHSSDEVEVSDVTPDSSLEDKARQLYVIVEEDLEPDNVVDNSVESFKSGHLGQGDDTFEESTTAMHNDSNFRMINSEGDSVCDSYLTDECVASADRADDVLYKAPYSSEKTEKRYTGAYRSRHFNYVDSETGTYTYLSPDKGYSGFRSSCISPKSVTSNSDPNESDSLPLEMSSLSLARETPPGKVTFRKRRSRRSTPRDSPVCPILQSTPNIDDNIPMKRQRVDAIYRLTPVRVTMPKVRSPSLDKENIQPEPNMKDESSFLYWAYNKSEDDKGDLQLDSPENKEIYSPEQYEKLDKSHSTRRVSFQDAACNTMDILEPIKDATSPVYKPVTKPARKLSQGGISVNDSIDLTKKKVKEKCQSFISHADASVQTDDSRQVCSKATTSTEVDETPSWASRFLASISPPKMKRFSSAVYGRDTTDAGVRRPVDRRSLPAFFSGLSLKKRPLRTAFKLPKFGTKRVSPSIEKEMESSESQAVEPEYGQIDKGNNVRRSLEGLTYLDALEQLGRLPPSLASLKRKYGIRYRPSIPYKSLSTVTKPISMTMMTDRRVNEPPVMPCVAKEVVKPKEDDRMRLIMLKPSEAKTCLVCEQLAQGDGWSYRPPAPESFTQTSDSILQTVPKHDQQPSKFQRFLKSLSTGLLRRTKSAGAVLENVTQEADFQDVADPVVITVDLDSDDFDETDHDSTPTSQAHETRLTEIQAVPRGNLNSVDTFFAKQSVPVKGENYKEEIDRDARVSQVTMSRSSNDYWSLMRSALYADESYELSASSSSLETPDSTSCPTSDGKTGDGSFADMSEGELIHLLGLWDKQDDYYQDDDSADFLDVLDDNEDILETEATSGYAQMLGLTSADVHHSRNASSCTIRSGDLLRGEGDEDPGIQAGEDADNADTTLADHKRSSISELVMNTSGRAALYYALTQVEIKNSAGCPSTEYSHSEKCEAHVPSSEEPSSDQDDVQHVHNDSTIVIQFSDEEYVYPEDSHGKLQYRQQKQSRKNHHSGNILIRAQISDSDDDMEGACYDASGLQSSYEQHTVTSGHYYSAENYNFTKNDYSSSNLIRPPSSSSEEKATENLYERGLEMLLDQLDYSQIGYNMVVEESASEAITEEEAACEDNLTGTFHSVDPDNTTNFNSFLED